MNKLEVVDNQIRTRQSNIRIYEFRIKEIEEELNELYDTKMLLKEYPNFPPYIQCEYGYFKLRLRSDYMLNTYIEYYRDDWILEIEGDTILNTKWFCEADKEDYLHYLKI